MNQQPPKGDFLRADELIGAFEALSPDDKLKLTAIEAIRRRGTGFRRGELIHEAFCRALTGERNCPRGTAFMAFMVQTMRNVAGHERRRLRRLRDVDDAENPREGADGRSAGPTPEDILMQKETAAAVHAIAGRFDDDPEAQIVLLGWDEELRGAALREATGLDQGQLDYAIRRIRTRMRKEHPQGWIT